MMPLNQNKVVLVIRSHQAFFYAVVLSVFLLLPNSSTAQYDKKIDSIKLLLSHAKGREKVNLVRKLNKYYFYIDQADSIPANLKQIEKEFSDADAGVLALIFFDWGLYYGIKADYVQMYYYYTKILELGELDKDTRYIRTTALLNMAGIFLAQCQYAEALEKCLKAVEYEEEEESNKVTSLSAYATLGNIYYKIAAVYGQGYLQKNLGYKKEGDEAFDKVWQYFIYYRENGEAAETALLQVFGLLAANLYQRGRHADADKVFRLVHDACIRHNDVLSYARLMEGWIEAKIAQGEKPIHIEHWVDTALKTYNMLQTSTHKPYTLLYYKGWCVCSRAPADGIPVIVAGVDTALYVKDYRLALNGIMFLSHYYSSSGNFDRAYYYETLSKAVNDSVKINQLTNQKGYLDAMTQIRAFRNEKEKQQKKESLLLSLLALLLVAAIPGYYLYLHKQKEIKLLIRKNMETAEARLQLPLPEVGLAEPQINETPAFDEPGNNASIEEEPSAILLLPSKEEIQEVLGRLAIFIRNERHLYTECTVNSIAKAVGTNSKYLSNIIKEQYKTNFRDYLNKERISTLLMKFKTNPEVMQYTQQVIAELSGFKSAVTFSNAFKKNTGIVYSAFVKGLLNDRAQ